MAKPDRRRHIPSRYESQSRPVRSHTPGLLLKGARRVSIHAADDVFDLEVSGLLGQVFH
jgi:hypothetical protein